MKTKIDDVKYCGCDIDKIQTAKPTLNKMTLKYLYWFITRRYDIHIKKDVKGRKPPWTTDSVLKEYRFTNVRREHDRETRWLIEHITSNPDICYEDKLLNCILFRLYNRHETAELLSVPIEFSKHTDWNPEWYRSVLEAEKKHHPNRTLFTPAFNTGGLKVGTRKYVPIGVDDAVYMRPLYAIDYWRKKGIVTDVKLSNTQRDVYNVLSFYKGLGPFLSYQIFVDFTYIDEFPFSENEFVIAGPGCRKGLDYLFEYRGGMSYEECLFWLRDHLDHLFKKVLKVYWNPEELFCDLPMEDRYMNVMSLENCFCELSKYIRAKTHIGRPRRRYIQKGR